MKRLALILLAAVLAMSAGNTPQDRYIERYSDIAVSEMQRTGVPASVTLAQGMLESGCGQSTLTIATNNHFGIKCHKDWKGGKYFHDDDKKNECFRVYENPEESFRDHSDFLRYQDRYKPLFDLATTDYKGWATGLKAAGYATDPEYASKLVKYIEDYRLYRFDTGVTVEPEAPLELEKPRPARTAPSSRAERKYDETVKFSLSSPIMETNGVCFVYAVAGDTYESIAAANNLFRKEIRLFNEVGPEVQPEVGEVVYLQRKKARAAKGIDKYVVSGEGETLHSICQRFAVREKAIRKLNKFDKEYQPGEGDTIVLGR